MPALSDEEVIKTFEGDYVADGKFKSPSNDKDPWFPPKDLQLNLKMQKLPDGRVVGKISLQEPPHTTYQGKAEIEAAEYRVVGDKLCAVRLKVIGNVTADEMLEMQQNGTLMLHTVKFSDGDLVGLWTCPKKPKGANP